MNHLTKIVTVAALVALAGCSKSNDTAGDAVAANADATADAMDNRADVLDDQGLENQADALENQADVTRDVGKKEGEVIDAMNANTANAVAP